MSTIRNVAVVSLIGLLAGPVSAQVIVGAGTVRDRVEETRRRAEEARARAAIDSGFLRTSRTSRTSRGSSRVPRGHLPPQGMCRLWIDGVPPGHQPSVTDCATAEQMRWRTANSRVIYGDRESFPGKGKGKFKNVARTDRTCSLWDRVIVNGQAVPVCRDDRVERDRRYRAGWFGYDGVRFEDDSDRRASAKLSKSQRNAAKAARKGSK